MEQNKTAWSKRFSKPAFLFLAVLALSSCTEEKARALYTAALNFQTQASTALDKIAALYLFDFQAKEETEEQRQQEFLNGAREVYAASGKLDAKDFRGYLNTQNQRAQTQQYISDQISAPKASYVSFAETLESLPHASLLAAGEVPCAMDVGAKLVHDMARMDKAVQDNLQTDYRQRNEIRMALAKAIKNNDQAQQATLTGQLFALENKRHQLTEEARKQIWLAVKSGMETVELGQRYGDIDVATLLGAVNKIISVAGGLPDVDLAKVGKEMSAMQAKLGSNTYWKQIGDMKIGELPSRCRSSS